MIIVYCRDPESIASVAFTVKVKLPAEVGRPLIVPEYGLSARPVGSLPLDDHTQAMIQPDACSVCE